MVKIWFSVFIYQAFKGSKEAMKYSSEVTIKIKILKTDNFSGVFEVTIMKLDYIFAPFVLFFVR